MPRLLIVAHDHLSPGGAIEARFVARGYEVCRLTVVPPDRFDDPGVEVSFPDAAGFDAIVVLGAKWSAYAEEVARWVGPELDLLRAADAAGVPVLGICFGAQQLAQALGGSVSLSPSPEIGLHVVEGAAPVGGIWFEWHFDRVVAPPGAVVTAHNPAATQAFELRRNLAVQFHPEVDADGVAGWLANGGRAAVEALGLDPGVLVEQLRHHDPAIRPRAAALVDHFLDVVAVRG